MKQASVYLKLQKELALTKTEVTPIEAMVLVALHQRNVGDTPIDPKEIGPEEDIERSQDEELDRLRKRYGVKAIQLIAGQVRDLPETFLDAIERGLKISMPSGLGGTIAEVKLV